jgi:hypothetical protein
LHRSRSGCGRNSAANTVGAFQRAAPQDEVNAVLASDISEVALERWAGRLHMPAPNPPLEWPQEDQRGLFPVSAKAPWRQGDDRTRPPGGVAAAQLGSPDCHAETAARHKILSRRSGRSGRSVGRLTEWDVAVRNNRRCFNSILSLARMAVMVMVAASLSLHSSPSIAKLPPTARRLSPSFPQPTPSPPAHLVQSTTLLAPVTPACISSPFGPRILPDRRLAGTFHNGIDLPAPAGAPVRAIAPGVVIRVQRHGPGGLEMLVQHSGFIGIYSHFGTIAPAIADGQRVVNGGEQLGVVGHTGVMYGMHLFFGMIVGNRAVDPAPYLALALCTAAHRTPGDTLAADGKVPPTRIYALVP